MKISALIVSVILLCTACTEKDPPIEYSTTYDYRLFIKNNRIIMKDFLHNDTVISRMKYDFTPNEVVVSYYSEDTSTVVSSTIYTIVMNGYAESSIEYPEHITVVHDDTFFMGRRKYFYNTNDQLLRVECEHRNPHDRNPFTLLSYTYEGGNRTGYSSYYPFSDCQFSSSYEMSDIASKIDIMDFGNGILGKTNINLIEQIVNQYSGFCDPHSSGTTRYDISYTLDDEGYVIQYSKSTHDSGDARYTDLNFTHTLVCNFEYRFLN